MNCYEDTINFRGGAGRKMRSHWKTEASRISSDQIGCHFVSLENTDVIECLDSLQKDAIVQG